MGMAGVPSFEVSLGARLKALASETQAFFFFAKPTHLGWKFDRVWGEGVPRISPKCVRLAKLTHFTPNVLA